MNKNIRYKIFGSVGIIMVSIVVSFFIPHVKYLFSNKNHDLVNVAESATMNTNGSSGSTSGSSAGGGSGTSGGGGGQAKMCYNSSEYNFGGRNTVAIPCTCEDDKTISYLDDYVTGDNIKLLYEAGQSRMYREYNLYGKYYLGCYKDQSDTCLFEIYEDVCIDLNPDGILGDMPGFGTSN